MLDPVDDLGPDDLGGEAEAQREQTVMPWIWGGMGLVVIAAFVAWAIYGGPQTSARQPPAASQMGKPIGRGY